MKEVEVKILKSVVVKGEAVKKGKVLKVDTSLARQLVYGGRASLNTKSEVEKEPTISKK